MNTGPLLTLFPSALLIMGTFHFFKRITQFPSCQALWGSSVISYFKICILVLAWSIWALLPLGSLSSLFGSAGLHFLLDWFHLELDILHPLLTYLSIQFGAQISQIKSWCISAWLFWNSLASLLCSLLEALLKLNGTLSNYKWCSDVSNCSWAYII